MLTGESQPIEKEIGHNALAATLVLGGRIYIEVEKAGTATVASQIGKIMDNTIDYRTVLETRHKVLANKTVLPTLGLSALALSLLGPVSAIAVTSANFSEVLRVVAPMGMLNYLRLATQGGILIKDGRALELLKQVDTIVFDKTGTLTLDQPHVETIFCRAGFTADTLLKYAATAEYRQTHPIAKAILIEAENRQLELWSVDAAKYEVGYGLKVQINQQTVRVGSQRFMELEQIITPAELTAALAEVDTDGASLIYVAVDDILAGVIELRATIRPEAKAVIQDLKAQGMSLYIISGDHAGPTQKLADSLGIDNFFAEVLPEDKANLVKQLQTEGRFVCFVGDGINDAIALKQANVSVSLRGASTIATDTAQIVLMNQNLTQLTEAFELASGFNENSRNTLMTTFVPGIVCVGGIFFLHFGIYSSILLYNASLAAGITNSMWPWLRQSKQLVAIHHEVVHETFTTTVI
jgi:Cu2+-exporting ATPase